MKTLLTSFRMLAVLTLLTGALYPAVVWAVGRFAFGPQAGGSLIQRDGQIVGSALLAQKNEEPRYFRSRPSAGDFATVASGASNLAWTSEKLATRIKSAGENQPADLVTTSGSGLDPHLSPEAIRAQIDRVLASRGWSQGQRVKIDDWIAANTSGGQFGPAYVNVLQLNLALDRIESGQ